MPKSFLAHVPRPLAILSAVLVVSGCFSYRTAANSELRAREFVHVSADSGFVMQLHQFDGTPIATPCRLTRAEGVIRRIAADTLWLEPIARAVPRPGESEACGNITRGYFTRHEGISLGARRYNHAKTRNGVAIVLLTVAAFVVLWEVLYEQSIEVYNSP